MNAPLAPMQCQAGRSPLGRTGITDDEVCVVGLAHQPGDVDALGARAARAARSRSGPSPTAPKLCTSAPSRLRMTAVPPAVPAGDNRIVSTSWPSEPSGMDSMPMHVGVEDVHADGGDLHWCLLVDERLGGSVAA